MSGKSKKGSTEKYRKRRKKERENRAIKKRRRAEFEFAQRIQEEPSLKEVMERDGMSIS